jgi:hypothetical protein
MRTPDTIRISGRGCQTVSSRPAVRDGVAVDVLQIAEEFSAELDESVDSATLYAEYRRLAAKQAALRRHEPGSLRCEWAGEVTLVGAANESDAPANSVVGTRYPIGSDTLAAVVRHTGQVARIDTYENVAGALAARMRKAGTRATVAVPVFVDGNVWGNLRIIARNRRRQPH